MTNIKRWSDQKLEKELWFAIAALDSKHSATVAWLSKLKIEALRRVTIKKAA